MAAGRPKRRPATCIKHDDQDAAAGGSGGAVGDQFDGAAKGKTVKAHRIDPPDRAEIVRNGSWHVPRRRPTPAANAAA